jgi:hypothetical protein
MNPELWSGEAGRLFAPVILFGVLVTSFILFGWETARRKGWSRPESWIPTADADLFERLGCYCAARLLWFAGCAFYFKGQYLCTAAKVLRRLAAAIQLVGNLQKRFNDAFCIHKRSGRVARLTPNDKLTDSRRE